MTPHTRERWGQYATTFAAPFREIATRIASRNTDDFECLWLISDFAQLSVRYPALLILAYARSNRAIWRVVSSSIAVEALSRPTLGTWVGFLRQALGALQLHGRSIPFPGLRRFTAAESRLIEELVRRRNELAHGALGRYEASAQQVEEFSEIVFGLTVLLGATCATEPVPVGERLEWVNPGTDTRFPLEPFLITGADHHLRLYDGFDGQSCYYVSSATREGVTGATVNELTEFLSAAAERRGVDTGSAGSLLEQSRLAVESFRRTVASDFFFTDRFFGHLPPFAGRPALGRYLADMIAAATDPLVLNLVGPRGAGKRSFLLDLVDELWRRGHVVIPACLSSSAKNIAGVFNEAVGVAGDLGDLVQACARRTDRNAVLGFVQDRHSRDGADRAAIVSLAERCRALKNVSLVLVTDQWPSDPIESLRAVSTSIEMPPMEPASVATFYERVCATCGDAPLTDFELLPNEVLEVIGWPADLVTTCELYAGRTLAAGLSVSAYRRLVWESKIACVAGSQDLRRSTTILGETMRLKKTRQLQRREVYDRVAERERKPLARDLELLQRSGYLVIDDAVRFADFEWLVRALTLTLPPHGQPTDRDLEALVTETASFTPLGDALAEWAADSDAAEFERVFRVAASSSQDNQPQLVEALLMRAYSHNDSGLLHRLVDAVLALRDKPACRGCAAAAQQFIVQGGAVDVGLKILERCLAVARDLGFSTLEAELLNEQAVVAGHLWNHDRREQMFWTASRLAGSLQLAALQHTAANNAANVALERLSRSDVTHPSERIAAIRAVADALRPYTTVEHNRGNWHRMHRSLGLLASALTLLPGDAMLSESYRVGKSARALADRFGDFGERARAADAFARVLATCGADNEAVEVQMDAVRFARAAAKPVIEAQYERTASRMLLDLGRQTESLAHCQAARRALERLPSSDPVLQKLKAEVWREIAELLLQLGDVNGAERAWQRSRVQEVAALHVNSGIT